MKLSYVHQGKNWEADFSSPQDLSIPLSVNGPRAWYVDSPVISPVMENGFVGSIERGGKVNFFNVFFNPHGHGTHTETYGHIDPKQYPISNWKGPYCAHALLITITPEVEGQDSIVRWSQIQKEVEIHMPLALIIRTLPNGNDKKSKNYSSTNFPYLESKVGEELNRLGVLHLLVDLPSVDREEDGGALACHHAYWGYPTNIRTEATISEMIYVDNEILDGLYCLYLQPPSFAMDAAPSRPVIYPTHLKQ